MNGYFLDSFRRERDDLAREAHAGVADTVGDHVTRTGSSAVDAQVESGNRHGIGVNCWIFRSDVSGSIRSHDCQVEYATVCQRDITQQTF